MMLLQGAGGGGWQFFRRVIHQPCESTSARKKFMDLINSHRGPGEDEEYYLTTIRLQTLVERRSKSVDVYVLKRIDPIDLQNIEEFVKLTDKSIPQKATNLRNIEEEKKDDI